MFGLGANPFDVVALNDFRKLRVFRQKAIAGVDGVSMADFRGGDNRRYVQIAVGCRWRSDANGFVGEAHMHGVGIRSRMHRNGLDPHFMRRTVNAKRDLAAVGDKDFFDRHRLSNHQQWLVKFDRLAAFDVNRGNGSGIWRDDGVHDLHRLND